MSEILSKSKTLFLMQKIKSYKLHPIASNNIFEERTASNGPNYDNNNKIIPRSVVGKPDIIERIKKRIEDSKLSNSPKMKNSVAFSRMKQSYSNLSNMKKSQSSNKLQLLPDPVNFSILSRQVSHNKSSLAAQLNQHNNNANINVDQYLQETQIRIQSNEQTEKEKEKQLPLFERNARTRQSRVITSFQEVEQSWDLLNVTLQSKCATKSQEKLTLLQKSQAFRLRQQLLNEIPPPPKNWYQQLRDSPSLDERQNSQNVSNRVVLNSKTLLSRQQELENNLKIRGESKLRRELDHQRCPLITLGYDKVDQSESFGKLKFGYG